MRIQIVIGFISNEADSVFSGQQPSSPTLLREGEGSITFVVFILKYPMACSDNLYDRQTQDYYNSHAAESFQLYNSISSPYINQFPQVFPPGGKILDLGCGAGRELQALRQLGYDAFGMDGSSELLNQILLNIPKLGQYIDYGMLPDGIPEKFDLADHWDGLLCSAVLQHIPDNQLFDTAFTFHRLLKQGGRLFLTIPVEYPLEKEDRDSKNRLFRVRPIAEVVFLLERIGFQLIDQKESQDSLNRDKVVWASLTFRKK